MKPIQPKQTQPSIEKKATLLFWIGAGLLLLTAMTFTAFLWLNHWEPSGNDVWGHMYKSKYMYDHILAGDWYPLYSPQWYNGIQLYRYWPPLAYYFMALLQWITGGDILHAYYLFAGCVCFLGGFPFLLMGKDSKRPVIAIGCALLWTFLPDNIRVFFCEGNMPRILTSVWIPYVIYFLWRYIRKQQRSGLIGLMLTMSLMTFTHLMFTAIVGIGCFLFLCFDGFLNRHFQQDIEALTAMVIGILIAGIWFIPALSGGMLSMGDSSSQVHDLLTFSLTTSLNPENRVTGVADTYYFGISILIITILGILLANKKQKAGFCFALLVLLGTTPAAATVTRHIPLGEFLWMTRFNALAYACFLLSLLEWNTLRKKYAILFMSLMIADSAVSLACLPRYYTPAPEVAKTDSLLLKEHVQQRGSLMDLSSFGSYPSWSMVTGDDAVDYTFGWAWQGAATAQNIMLVNEALEREEYLYVFDRSIELGDDAVMVRKSLVHQEKQLLDAAKACGYELIEETEATYLFQASTPETFGVATEYSGLTIGEYGAALSIYYPTFTTGMSNYIDDYSVEELTAYDTLFLSGFSYHNQKEAESLLQTVANQGTRLVIDCAHIPENGRMEKTFLGITQDTITLTHTFPNLHYKNDSIAAGQFPEGSEEWLTGYTNEPDQVLGYINEGGEIIPFLSYDSSNENIYYLGLNLAYFAMNTDNPDLWSILDDCFQLKYSQIPNREIIPISISMEGNTITIESEKVPVNTTLAFQDNFRTQQAIHNENNLLVIDEPQVTLHIVYPHLLTGSIVSLLGLLLGAGMIVYIQRRKRPYHTEGDSSS